MNKINKTILVLSALISLLISARALAAPSSNEVFGNDWSAIFDVPPFYEVTVENDTRGAAVGAPMNNESGGNDNDGYAGVQNLAMLAGIKDCASSDSLLLLLVLLALLTVYAVLRFARRRGRPFF